GVEIARARLEHERTPAGAARLEIEHEGDVLYPRVLADECGGAKQSRLLAVGEESDDVVRQWPIARAQSAERFEQRGGPGAIIRRGRPSLDAVVMRDDEHRLSSGKAAGKSRDNVL